MFNQTGKTTALYYYAAIENPHKLFLDNLAPERSRVVTDHGCEATALKMQLLLCVELAAHYHSQPKGGGAI